MNRPLRPRWTFRCTCGNARPWGRDCKRHMTLLAYHGWPDHGYIRKLERETNLGGET